MYLLFYRLLTISIALLCPFSELSAQNYTEHMAESIMERKPDSYGDWHYETGTVLRGFEALYKATKNEDYYQYLKSTVDSSVDNQGDIQNYSLDDYNLDQIKQGSAVLYLYATTGEQRYALAAITLMDQLDKQPQTSQGGNWHKYKHPNQMWLDGVYMAQPFNAQFGSLFTRSDNFDDVVLQLTSMEQKSRDSNTGLLFHAWDESKQAPWADNTTGRAPIIWSRAMGWYAMALVDVLDYIPQSNTSRRDTIIGILNRIVPAISNVQDETGVWWQVADKAGQEKNWRESSATAMFVYAIAKAVRKGYVEETYLTVAERGWQGILDNFVLSSGNTLNLTDTSEGTNVDANYRYYTERSRETNDPKGIGPFILAGVEMEFLRDNSSFNVQLQAEDQSWQNGTVDNDKQGYTGAGFVNISKEENTWFDLDVIAPVDGEYTISVRYANGSNSARPQEIMVNGVAEISYFDMPSTRSWENWVTRSFVIALNSGSNTIRFVSLSSGGAPNLDRFDVSASNISSPKFPVTPTEPLEAARDNYDAAENY